MRWRRVGKREPISMVLLLRKPHVFSEEEVRLAAERAWALSFSSIEGSSRAVTRSGGTIFLRAGPYLFSFCDLPKPYVDNPKENLSWLPKVSQQQAWGEHTACGWVNYVNPDTDVELAQCVLAKLVVQLLDGNCTGVYSPSESSLIPANESLYDDLQRMASYRDFGLVRTSQIAQNTSGDAPQ